jgi:hypothetical protein
MVGYHMGRCRLHRSYHANFIAQWCNNRGGEATGLHMHGKMRSKNDLYTSSDSSCDMLYTSWDTATISKTCPTIRPEQPERGTKRHKGGPTFWCTRFPIERTQPPKASYLSLDSEVSITPLRLGWRPTIWDFCTDYPVKKRETTWSRFDRGGISPYQIPWRGTCTTWLPPE